MQSCGCLRRDVSRAKATTHGLRNSREYAIWLGMVQRCHTPSSTSYPRYGARGIAVCDAWRGSFEQFYADMGPAPSAEHSIERRENDGRYEKGNCFWTTAVEQSNNKRSNRILEWRGEARTIAEWARVVGIAPTTIQQRLTYGWDAARALSTPVTRRGRNSR